MHHLEDATPTDLDQVLRFRRLARDGSVTYAHRCMDIWLRQPCDQPTQVLRVEACEAIRAEYPFPEQGK